MSKVTKGHYSWNIFRIYSKESGYLLIIINQFNKFQCSSSNNLKYSADKVKMPKITKDHNSWSIFLNYFKSQSDVCSSLPVYSSSFKALALIVFRYMYFNEVSISQTTFVPYYISGSLKEQVTHASSPIWLKTCARFMSSFINNKFDIDLITEQSRCCILLGQHFHHNMCMGLFGCYSIQGFHWVTMKSKAPQEVCYRWEMI